MKIYTVHKNPLAKADEDAFLFVPEEFNWWAFIFPLGIIWAIQKKCWLFLALNIALLALYASTYASFSGLDIYVNITKLPVQLALGLFANDFLRASYRKQGFEFAGIIGGKDETEAFRNWLIKH